jgi:hypothetical protein
LIKEKSTREEETPKSDKQFFDGSQTPKNILKNIKNIQDYDEFYSKFLFKESVKVLGNEDNV